MTKKELLCKIAAKTAIPQRETEVVVNALLEEITEALATGDSVQIVGFGTFEVRDRAARSGVDPRTGESIDIPAGRCPAFKAGKSLKTAVR